MELVLLPLYFGLVAFIVSPKYGRYFILAASLTSLGAGLARLFSYQPDTYQTLFSLSKTNALGFSMEIGYDGLSLVMVGLSNLVFFLVALANLSKEESRSSLFNGLFLLMQFGLNGLFLAQDGLLFYVFWELALIPIFLILYWFGANDSQKTWFKFFLYTLFGSLGMLFSLIALTQFGFKSFAYVHLLQVVIPNQYACWIMSGFLLAFAIKIPIFPFHSWQANTYDAAPMAGTMLLSAIMLKMALFGLIKWMIPLNPGGLSFWQLPVIILGVVGILYGALIATRENNIKKVFAFASLSHLGLIVAGIMIFTQESLTASVVQMVNHSLIAIGLFLAANRLEVGFGSKELSTMGGIAKLAPTFGVWFGIITLIALSVPLTAGFLGEFLLIKSVFQFNLWLGVLSSLTLVLGAVYMLRSYQMSMMGAPAIGAFEDLPVNEILVYFIITALTLFIGLFPEFLIQIIKPSIEQIILHTQNPALTIR